MRLGRLVGLTENGTPLVEPTGASGEPLGALTTVELGLEHVGAQVSLLFVDGDARRPLVTGIVRSVPAPGTERRNAAVRLDGQTLVLTAQREIVLQCGEASVVLRADGKLTLRGRDLLSRSSGPNKIKGGSVQIN